MICSASTFLKLAGRLLSLLAVILFLPCPNVEAASATARLGVTVRVVSRCGITTGLTENSLDAQATTWKDANVKLTCSSGFNAVISPDASGGTVGQTPSNGSGIVSDANADVSGAGADTKTLTINF